MTNQLVEENSVLHSIDSSLVPSSSLNHLDLSKASMKKQVNNLADRAFTALPISFLVKYLVLFNKIFHRSRIKSKIFIFRTF